MNPVLGIQTDKTRFDESEQEFWGKRGIGLRHWTLGQRGENTEGRDVIEQGLPPSNRPIVLPDQGSIRAE
jgi:hypothetical protein